MLYGISICGNSDDQCIDIDKQQQLKGMCVELEAVNSKGNSSRLIQIVKSMTQKF